MSKHFGSLEEWYVCADVFAYRFGSDKHYIRRRLKNGDFDSESLSWSGEWKRLSENGKRKYKSKYTREDIAYLSSEMWRVLGL